MELTSRCEGNLLGAVFGTIVVWRYYFVFRLNRYQNGFYVIHCLCTKIGHRHLECAGGCELLIHDAVNAIASATRIKIVEKLDMRLRSKCYGERIHGMVSVVVTLCPIFDMTHLMPIVVAI